VSAAALTQEQAEDVALLVGKRAEAGRGALDPLPVIGRQVVLAVAAAPGCRLAAGGVRRQLILARAGAMNCPEPVTPDFKVPPIRWPGKSTCANINLFKPG
jgi:hypothetical protein